MKEKGIKILVSIFLFASVLMPFSVYAAEQTQIVPTWNWGSQYSNQFTVTNFCEGSGTSVSCELRFTANNSYYGYLSFDGYNGTTKWIDYKNVWIADGYGAYRYSLYQNGVIQINKINIEGGFLKSSMDNLDLQDIIDLLTEIETDTTSIDNQINTELQRLQSIINNQITQNGYLEILTKMQTYNFPIESLGAIFYLAKYHGIDNYFSYGNYYYPYFEVSANERLLSFYASAGIHYYLILGSNPNIYSLEYFNQCFSFVPNSSGTVTVNSCRTVKSYGFGPQYQIFNFVILDIQVSAGGTYYLDTNINMTYMPIYYGISNDPYISTDFAIEWGLSNKLLDNIQIIAQGTQQSNSAASGLESSNSTMASDMNSMATIENGYSQDFNSQLQNIDFTNPIQQNQGLLPAANFVISIFNGLISNNPFTVLIIIVCILLIGKKVIGK